ncbi:hypothetical protein TIFTF001_004232 [Ficus carica]|uniref:Uncharacterized protein n=1 Tax=Ficus carica TaxID=3494 RepID=A0AA88CWU6_FICCA|nr:hypothetical protein TIFTF001_004232 [Ficus carica]
MFSSSATLSDSSSFFQFIGLAKEAEWVARELHRRESRSHSQIRSQSS